MAQTAKIVYSDGKNVTVRIGPRAQVAFERHYSCSVYQASIERRMEHFYYLAWKALQFAGEESRDFDEFLDALEDVTFSEAEAVDPTQSDQPPED